MDHLRPGQSHRSSSDRLLSNYLESQKLFTTSLLALLSQSHSSTSSLLAYVTSSPGVLLSVRRAVRHSAFEGPLSPSMLENPEAHIGSEEPPTPGWAGYIRGLDDFRKDLKQIHLLEEEMTRVKRDKEILVGRLIKQTKTRPTKTDLKEMAKTLNPDQLREYETMSSRASSISIASDMSAYTAGPGGKETRRASKLKEAQAELLGCEEHLRALEVRIESERNNVMYRGLEERFRAMEIVSQMWLAQARAGLEDLERLPNRVLPNGHGHANGNVNAFELESNGSLAPSQSASQVGFDEAGQSHPAAVQGAIISPRRQIASQRQLATMHGPGSITSVREENESSDEEHQGTLVVHENVRRPASAHAQVPHQQQHNPSIPMKDFNPPGGRRAMSELGQPSRYSHAQQNPPLRRAMSNDHVRRHRPSPGSDTSSNRTVTKKKGFFASIARFFKGPSSKRDHGRRRPGSPTSNSTWGKDARPTQQYGRRVRSDSSSDEDDISNLVSVSNRMSAVGTHGTWNAADVGKVPMQPKRSKSSVSKTRSKTRSTVTAGASGQTTPRARPASAAGRAQTTATNATITAVSRSNTVRSTPAAGKRASTLPSRSRAAATGPNIMTIVGAAPPAMPDVPKAPKSQSGPMELVKAPGSSLAPGLILPSQVMHQPRSSMHSAHRPEDDELGPNDSISRVNSTKVRKPTRTKSVERRKSLGDKKDRTVEKAAENLAVQEKEKRPVSPLPPSKLRSPPLKSAMRPTSPTNYSSPMLPPPQITTLYDVHAPGPVQLPLEQEEPKYAPSSYNAPLKRMPTADDASIYESANEDAPTPRAVVDESSDDESVDASAFQIINNNRPESEQHEYEGRHLPPLSPGLMPQQDPHTPENSLPPLPDDSGIVRRKSVRLEVPDNQDAAEFYRSEADREAQERSAQHARELEKERARMYLAAANASDESLPSTQRASGTWDTRIGRMREDTSEDDDDDPRYVKARRSLMSHKGDFKSADKEKKKKRLSTKSLGSRSLASMGSKRSSKIEAKEKEKGKPWRP